MEQAPSSLIAIVGATGAGKSALALSLAQSFGGEIVNCDSVQVHRGLDIGSAKLPIAERLGIPHHLLDLIEPQDELTAGEYATRARPVLDKLREAGTLALVVGGTGFYLRALLDGLSPAPRRDPGLRNRLTAFEARRTGGLHRYLRRFDAQAAKRIHAHDVQKLIRAVELTVLAGRPASATQREPRMKLAGFAVLKLGLEPDRPALYQRLNERSRQMFTGGLLEETRRLLDAGVPATAKSLQTLGYRQVLAALKGDLTLEAAIVECQQKTRQYAKRQMTWFRREPEVHWLCGFGDDTAVQAKAKELVSRFLGLENGLR